MRILATSTLSAMLLGPSLLVSTQSASAETFAVSTLSGTGGVGVFNTPSGVSVSPDGSIYVADQRNFQIKKIVGGNVSFFANGQNVATLETTNSFCSVFVKSADEIFASDCLNSKVYKYDKNGQLIRTYVMGLPLPNRYYDWGGGLAVDLNGGIFLSDEHNRVIIRIDENSDRKSVV